MNSDMEDNKIFGKNIYPCIPDDPRDTIEEDKDEENEGTRMMLKT
jgi:hypothetical protein